MNELVASGHFQQQLSIPERLEAASRAIEACTDLSELKQMDDQAAALVAAVKASKLSPQIQRTAMRVKNEALLRLGELLLRTPGKATYADGGRNNIKVSKSARRELVDRLCLNRTVAACATRLAAGGPAVRAKLLSAKTIDPTRLARLAPPRRTVGNSYKSDLARAAMRGGNISGGSGLVGAKAALTGILAIPLREMDPRDKPRVREHAVQCQELIDEILRQLE